MSEGKFRVAVLASGDRKSGGGGSTAERFARDTLEGKVGLEVGVVISNNPRGTVAVHDKIDAINTEFGLKGDRHIDVVTINSFTHPEGRQPRGQTLAESAAICRLLEQRGIGFVAMLGYMKILTGEFVEEWGWKPEYGAADPTHNGRYHPKARISNNHPAILPFTVDTHGHGAHEKAVKLYKEKIIKYSAMTFHLGSAAVDTGPVYYEHPLAILEEGEPDYFKLVSEAARNEWTARTVESLETRMQAKEKELTAPTIERHVILRAEHLRGHS